MFIEKMNIETLNNIIGNTLNRVIAKAIDSIGALPVGGKYIFAASNPFTILVQRDAFADYPTVIFQDVKTGKDFFALKDVSKKSREDLQNSIMNHVQKTGVNSDNLQFLSFNEFLKKSFDRNRIYRNNPIRIKIFDVLKKLDKKEMTVLLKNRVFDTWIKDNLNYDQLIWEFGTDVSPNWIHVSYVSEEENRNRCLKAYKEDGKTKYKII